MSNCYLMLPQEHLIGLFKLNVAVIEHLIPPTALDLLLPQQVAHFQYLLILVTFAPLFLLV